MNTLYVLKGGMKFKFLALTVVILLSLGVGNTAWGQFYTNKSGSWTDSSIWYWDEACSSPANTNPSAETWKNVTILAGATITQNGNITSCATTTVNGTLIVNGTHDCSSGSFTLGNNATLTVTGDANFGSIATESNSKISVDGSLVTNGASSFGTSNTVSIGKNLSTNVKFSVGQNSIVRIENSFIHNTATTIEGEVYVEKDYMPTGGSLTITPTGKLVVKGEARTSLSTTINGQLLVSGDFDFPGGSINVGGDASFVVGGDLTVNVTVTVDSDGFLGVFGDFTNSAGTPTITGEMVVVGNINGGGGCPACERELEDNDPVWGRDIPEGINAIMYEQFNYVNGTTSSGRWNASSGASVQTNQLSYSNSTGSAFTGVLWETENIPVDCNNRIRVSGDILVAGAGTVSFKYSTDLGNTWEEVDESVSGIRRIESQIPGTQIMLRIEAIGLPNAETVTIDNILISATNEGGIPADPVVWIDQALIATTLCPPETVTYSIDNDNGGLPRYSSIVWKFTQGGGVITPDADDPATCTVDWETLPGELSVTVTGGSCGGETTELTSLIAIAKSPDIVLHSTVTPISCNGVNDGSITVVGDCGPDNGEPLVYTWESVPAGVTNPGGNTSASNLPPGDYTITVTKGSGQMDTKTITLTEPEVLAVTFTNLNNFLCAGHEGTGSFTVVPTGGTSPYTVAVNGTPYPDPADWAFINFSNGTYNIVVTDAHGCEAISEVVVQLDTEAPTFTAFPANVQMTMAEYQANTGSKLTTTTSNLTGGTLSDPSALTITPALPSLSGLHNLKLSFTVSQSSVSANDADVFYVEMTTDGTTYVPILTDPNSLDNQTVTIPLGENADGNTNLGIRFTATIATAGLTYTVSNVQISGSRFAVNYPTCNDNSGNCASPTFTDSAPIWNGECISYVDGEFRIERVWRGEDACGLPVERTQYLSVGTAPEFTLGTFPTNLDLDFCHNEPTVTAPTATDACGTATVSWVAKNSSNEVIGSGDNTDLSGVTFPADAAGNTDLEYTVTWTATDEAHMTLSQDQKITIKPAIAFDYFQIASSENICQNEEVTVNLKPKGGTGVFDHPSSFAPVVTSPDVLGATSWEAIGTGVYQCKVQFGATASARTFTITVTDRNGSDVTGGCSAPLESASFNVHDLIPTGGISRE